MFPSLVVPAIQSGDAHLFCSAPPAGALAWRKLIVTVGINNTLLDLAEGGWSKKGAANYGSPHGKFYDPAEL